MIDTRRTKKAIKRTAKGVERRATAEAVQRCEVICLSVLGVLKKQPNGPDKPRRISPQAERKYPELKSAFGWLADDLCAEYNTGVIDDIDALYEGCQPTFEEVAFVLSQLSKLGYFKQRLMGDNKGWIAVYTWNTAPRNDLQFLRTIRRRCSSLMLCCLLPFKVLYDCCAKQSFTCPCFTPVE